MFVCVILFFRCVCVFNGVASVELEGRGNCYLYSKGGGGWGVDNLAGNGENYSKRVAGYRISRLIIDNPSRLPNCLCGRGYEVAVGFS